MGLGASRTNKRTLQLRFRSLFRCLLDGYPFPKSSQARAQEKEKTRKEIEEEMVRVA